MPSSVVCRWGSVVAVLVAIGGAMLPPSRAEGVLHHAGYGQHVDPDHDPLFDHGTRPSWAQQHLERPRYDRPSYADDLPAYAPPRDRLEPVRKPAYERPLGVVPLENKPNNRMANEAPPNDFLLTPARPTDWKPQDLIRPESLPALQRPGYERSTIFYARPEYQAPDDPPAPFQFPRVVRPEKTPPAR